MTATRLAKDQLKAFVERIERLEEEKKAIADDIRDIYGEAKANGFDAKALRDIIKLRKLDANERIEHQSLVETYMHALGMLTDGTDETPSRKPAAAQACAARVDTISSSPVRAGGASHTVSTAPAGDCAPGHFPLAGPSPTGPRPVSPPAPQGGARTVSGGPKARPP